MSSLWFEISGGRSILDPGNGVKGLAVSNGAVCGIQFVLISPENPDSKHELAKLLIFI